MKILVVDDHVIVREGVRRLLSPLPDLSVMEAATAHAAETLFRTHRPDIVLLDLNLPHGSGLHLLRRLVAEDQKVRVLVFSMHSEPLYVAHALDTGARGFISKSAPATELVTAVQRVAAGGQYVEHDIAAQIVLNRFSSERPFTRLTTREVDIMRQLGEGRTLAAIATALGVSYKTVANSCTIIKTKLGAQRVADLIRIAIEMRSG